MQVLVILVLLVLLALCMQGSKCEGMSNWEFEEVNGYSPLGSVSLDRYAKLADEKQVGYFDPLDEYQVKVNHFDKISAERSILKRGQALELRRKKMALQRISWRDKLYQDWEYLGPNAIMDREEYRSQSK
jgi:hypothetical protein